MILNIVVALASILIIVYVVKHDFDLALASYIILIQYIWMFFSLIVIENGIFINEQGRDSYFVYSSLVLLSFLISTLLSLVFFKKIFLKLLEGKVRLTFSFLKLKETKLILFLVSIVLILAFFNLFSSPIPLLSDEVTKFNFWEHSKYPFLRSIIGNVMGFVAFAVTILFRTRRKLSIFLFFLYFSYLLLLGQKFTGFLIGSYGILLVYFLTSEKRIKFKITWIFNWKILSAGAIIYLLVFFYYSHINNPFLYMGLTPVESVYYRAFGLQAHVFWGLVEKYVYLNAENTWDISELWNGMQLIMREFWPWEDWAYFSVTDRGVNWTNAYPAILLRIFPLPIALVVNFVLFSFVALVQSLLIFFLRNKSYLLSIITFQLLTWVSYAFTMAYFNKLILPVIGVVFILFLLDNVIRIDRYGKTR